MLRVPLTALALALLVAACGGDKPAETETGTTPPSEPGPLAQELAAKKAAGMKKMPDEVKALIQRGGKELAATDLLAKARKAGAKADDFVLKDAMGVETDLAKLRKEGPVVIAFYRGKW